MSCGERGLGATGHLQPLPHTHSPNPICFMAEKVEACRRNLLSLCQLQVSCL